MADTKRPYPLLRQGGVYKPLSEADARALSTLERPTPGWLDRDYPYIPPPGESYSLKELEYLESLVPLREEWKEFIEAADEDLVGLFVNLCSELGVPCNRDNLNGLIHESSILITKLKWLYNRPRPYQVAEKHGLGFSPMGSKTAHTPAYPSGHTVQAYLLASRLSELAPQHRKEFMGLADMISYSRMVGGYHWPSDLTFAKDVFHHIVSPHMPSSVRVAAKYKSKKEVPTKDGDTKTVYEYSDAQIAHRHREKAKKVESLRKGIDKIRSQAKKDLKSDDPKTRLTALAVLLIDQTYERTGNEDTAEESGRFGVTSWRTKHVSINGNTATIKYNGKSDVSQEKKVTDPAVVSALEAATRGKKGEERVFCDGEGCTVKGKDVNEYLKPFDVTAKDIRGMHANEEMKRVLSEIRKKGPQLPNDRKEKDKILKEEFKKALEETAKIVGHEPSTLKSHYLVPKFEDSFMHDGSIIKELHKKSSAAASLAARWGSTLLSDSERETREDERLVRQSPKKKPPRRDLERGVVKDRDNSEVDPDEKQDKKDRSNNYKDASLISKWGVLLYAEEERRDGDVWKTDSGKWSGKFDGKTQVFESEQSAKDYASGNPKPEGSDTSEEPKKSLSESLLGGFDGLVSQDPKAQKDALNRLSADVADNIGDFVSDPAYMDPEAREEINKALSDNLDSDTLDVLVSEAQDRALGDNANNPGYELTDRDKVEIEREFEKGFVEEFKKQFQEINDRAKDRESKAKDKKKKEDDNRIISDLTGEEARQMENHMLETTKSSLERHRGKDKEERKSELESIESHMKEYPEGSKKRMELESEKRGLMVANILTDGPEAEGVGPSMSVLIQAADKIGKLDSFLDLSLLDGENTTESQQEFRNVLKEVGVSNLTEFMNEDNPAVKAIEVLNDPGFISRASSESKEELEEMVIDSIVSGIIFTDAALEEEMPGSTVSKKNKSKIKVPQTESVLDRLNKLLEKLRKL